MSTLIFIICFITTTYSVSREDPSSLSALHGIPLQSPTTEIPTNYVMNQGGTAIHAGSSAFTAPSEEGANSYNCSNSIILSSDTEIIDNQQNKCYDPVTMQEEMLLDFDLLVRSKE